ncbi:HAD family hydrolase [Vibrio splendidus]|uniref:Hydrolase n=1 Tax=Vibrio splendidus 12E03 TaxID=1191305 RepID=A0A1E5FF46_VIBSP|nr:HAD family hydrolase [Vibrio splendidus]OEF88370.1 hydrolase [Vibrio splendidus 12E03]
MNKTTKPIELTEVVLFDWGNTLMVDFPDAQGKMCDWETVQEVSGARVLLAELSKNHQVYVATNAGDLTEQDIIQAFERVGLSQYLSGYFCKASLGVSKYDSDFYPAIITQLGVQAQDVTMIGDTLEKDIYAALASGLHVVWLNTEGTVLKSEHPNIVQVQSLSELLEKYHG